MSGKWDDGRWSCGGAGAAKKFYRSTSSVGASVGASFGGSVGTSTGAAAQCQDDQPADTTAVIDKPKKSKRLKPKKWRAAFDKDGRLVGLENVLKSILSGGVDHSIRGEVWEFLLGCYALDTTSEYRQQLREARRERYKELIKMCQRMHASIGSGSLAYTVGSKVMDVRIMSRESAKEEAKLRTGPAKTAARSPLATLHEEIPKQLTDCRLCQHSSINKSGEASGFSDSDPAISKEASVTSFNRVYNMNSDVLDSDECSDSSSSEGEVEDLISEHNTDYLCLPVRTLFPTFVVEAEQSKIMALQDIASASSELEVSSIQVIPNSDSFNTKSQECRDLGSGSTTTITCDSAQVEGSQMLADTKNSIQDSSLKKSIQASNEDKSYDAVGNMSLGQQLVAEVSALKGVTVDSLSMKGVNAYEERVADWLWTLHRIVVDVVRTDRHLKFYDDAKNMARMSDILAIYAWIDPATGYCQGMSDLLSPFIVIFKDDADAFWCFESLLRRVRQNFQMDGPIGVMKQLAALTKILELTDRPIFKHLELIGADSFLFAFRMLLVLFRRELSFSEALSMWEMMWAADFDQAMSWALEYNCLESLTIVPPPSHFPENDVLEVNFSTEYGQGQKSPSISPQNQPSQVLPAEDDLADHLSRSPFCGLRAGNLWPKYSRPKVRTVSSLLGRTGDDELSVFIVAAILVLNRTKFLRETQSMDDAIKMFNDIQMKIRVKHCIRTAIKLRKKYRRQILKQAAMERRHASLQHSTSKRKA